uniref:Uncharacterized protein n=1 Tax=Caenorhabditis japonica TaxID=281687 RepID=A0A8R1IC93_CAEJA
MGGPPLMVLLLAVPVSVMADDTCLSRGQLFGVIFGSVAAAFLISAAFAMILYVWFRRSSKGSVQTISKSGRSYAIPEDLTIGVMKICRRTNC